MKISDVLWEAACKMSEGAFLGSCDCIEYSGKKGRWKIKTDDVTDATIKFYSHYFSPRDLDQESLWFGSEFNTTVETQNERFFHLLMAYEMTLSEGL